MARLRGLLRRPPLGPGDGLLLTRTSAVHTWGMRHPIDVVFLDREDRVLRVVAELGPRRAVAQRGARSVLELGTGEAARLGAAPGLKLLLPARRSSPRRRGRG